MSALSATLIVAIALTIAPALAASSMTETYVAHIRVQADVLAASDKLAATRAQADPLKRFADDDARHQSGVVSALDDWRAREQGVTPAQEVASLPIETGRSVALDAPVDVDIYAPPPGIGVLMAAASATLDHLSTLDGAAFDESFKATHHSALKTLEGSYESYSRNGDNAALREMATKELAAVRAEIAALDQT